MLKTSLHLLLSAVITLLLLYAVSVEISFEEFVGLIYRTDRKGLLLFSALSATALLFRAARYRWLVADCSEQTGAPAFASLVVVTAMRNAFVDFLPMRLGESVWFYSLNRYGVSLVQAAAVFGLCLIYDVFAILLLLLLLIIGEVFFFRGLIHLSGTDFTLSSLALVAMLCVFFGAVLRKVHHVVYRLSCIFARVAEHDRTKGSVERVLALAARQLLSLSRELRHAADHGHSLRVLLATLVLRFLKYLSLYVLLISVVSHWGIGPLQLSPLSTTMAFLAGEAAASLPISGLMGFGAYEGAWSVVFSGVGGRLPAITSVIFAVHIISQVVGYFWGLLGAGVFLSKHLMELRVLRKEP